MKTSRCFGIISTLDAEKDCTYFVYCWGGGGGGGGRNTAAMQEILSILLQAVGRGVTDYVFITQAILYLRTSKPTVTLFAIFFLSPASSQHYNSGGFTGKNKIKPLYHS